MKPQTKTLPQHALSLQYIRLFAIVALVMFIMSNPALANNPSQLDPVGILNKIIGVLNGGLARALAIIALIIMGIGCWFGFFDFRKIGFFFLGVLLVFGAAWILDQMGVAGGTT